jgi:hypothetical protein
VDGAPPGSWGGRGGTDDNRAIQIYFSLMILLREKIPNYP